MWAQKIILHFKQKSVLETKRIGAIKTISQYLQLTTLFTTRKKKTDTAKTQVTVTTLTVVTRERTRQPRYCIHNIYNNTRPNTLTKRLSKSLGHQ